MSGERARKPYWRRGSDRECCVRNREFFEQEGIEGRGPRPSVSIGGRLGLNNTGGPNLVQN